MKQFFLVGENPSKRIFRGHSIIKFALKEEEEGSPSICEPMRTWRKGEGSCQCECLSLFYPRLQKEKGIQK